MAQENKYLQQVLNNSNVQETNPALFQAISGLIAQQGLGAVTDRLTTLHNEFVLDDNTGLYLRRKDQSGNAEFPFRVSLTGQIFERFRTVALGEWQSYTPVWTASTTNPVLNTGLILGNYTRIGKTTIFRIYFRSASTTTFGTGDYRWTIPTTANAPVGYVVGQCLIIAAAGVFIANRNALVNLQSTTTVQMFLDNSAGAAVGSTTYAWGDNSEFYITGVYEDA